MNRLGYPHFVAQGGDEGGYFAAREQPTLYGLTPCRVQITSGGALITGTAVTWLTLAIQKIGLSIFVNV